MGWSNMSRSHERKAVRFGSVSCGGNGRGGRKAPADCRRRQDRKTTARRRKPPAFRPVGKLKHAPPRTSVFHEVSRAGRPSQQGRKTTAHRRKPPAFRPVGKLKHAPPRTSAFHEVSRAERPSQQASRPVAHTACFNTTMAETDR